MGLVSWAAFSHGSIVLHGAEVISAISGQSVFINVSQAANTRILYVPSVGQPQGLSSSRLRAIFRPDNLGGTTVQLGLTCRQTVRDPQNSGAFYAFHANTSLSTIAILKFPSGFDGASQVLISTPFAFTVGQPVYMEGRWVVDQGALSGVYLDMFIGQGQSFLSAGSASLSFLDVANPIFSAPVTEGFFVGQRTGGSVTYKVVVDDVQLFTSA